MSNVDFIGSQAFNQDNTGNESVIPNTGSLLVNLPLLKVLGIRDGIELDLTLSFSLGITGPYGLPQNWNINVPFIDADNSLHINNSRYITSTTWTDITGYPSGLKYVNNHATLFVDTQEQLPLPYGSSGEYYRYTYADPNGFVWYFNNTGQLLMKADLYANYLFYTYTTGGLLNSVVDSFEQTTTFGYGTNQLIITAPDGRTVAINYSASGVQNLVDPLGNITAFTYLQSSNFSLIQTITYPTGKITTATYTQLNYLGADGNQYPLPAISDLVYADTNGNMLGHYNYIYGEQSSGATFTGLFASYSLSAGSDGLLASNDTNYLYDVTEQMIDGSNNVLYKKDTFYNFAHVPVTENMYVIDASSGSSFLQTSTTYDMSGNQPNLQPTYLYPLQTQQDFFPSASANPVPQLLTTYSYDDYGNTLSKQVCSYASDGVTTVMQTNEVASYFTHDMSIYSLPDTVTKTDGITGQIIRTINTLTANQRDIGNSVMSSSTNGGDSWNAWKSLAKSFDTQGRIISQNYKWDVPKYSGVANASTSYAYQYNAAIFGVTTVVTDAVGNKSTTVISTMYGTKLSFTKSSGKATTYTYDLLGRVLSVINPSGAQTRYAYQCFQQSGVNTVALTDAIGYITTKTYDPLGRLLQVVDNGNPITPSKARTVSTRSYDLLGNVANETDLYGNATACTYNSLRKPVSTTDPFGNKTVFAYDYTAGSTTSSVNGVACKKSVVDGLGRVVLEQQFANSTRPSGSDIYTMSTERQFTGFGKTASESVSQIVGQTTNLLQTQKYVYDCDLRPFQQSFAGADGSTRTASTVFDLNGNEVATTKLTTYSGGAHYEVQSELRSYDAVSQLLAVVNAMDQKESYTYDGDGNLVKKVLPNKTSIAYAYTDDGYKSNETWQTSSDKFAIAFAYDAVGHLTATTDSSGTIGMTYALDGVPTGISYPDGKSITYGLDQYSRRASLVDAAGTTTNYSYTPTNQLSVVKNAVDTLTYDYYTDVKSNTLFGAPKSVSLGGQYIETNYYDAQNRVAKTIKLTPANKILLQEDLTYSPLNQIVTSMLSSNLNKTSSLNCSRTFTYDSLTQLIGDHLVDQAGSVMLQTSFQYDGNSNVLKKTAIDGTTTFTYNAIDQLTQYTDASGKPKMLTYGTNGELLQDGAGTNYSYDLLGRLQQTKLTEGNVAYTYYANQLMATRSGTPGTNQFYYDTQQMAVNSAKNNLVTSFLSAERSVSLPT